MPNEKVYKNWIIAMDGDIRDSAVKIDTAATDAIAAAEKMALGNSRDVLIFETVSVIRWVPPDTEYENVKETPAVAATGREATDA